ncbi:GGDEF domain-containing protein [Variovorax sp. H27-G14]|uniref:GGDEF domain-containing protein n=1 Tax=Variovorax sp. H27-G14 TaxID=3111914 RepID=UPI0038FCCF60
MQLDVPSLMLPLGLGYLLFAWQLVLVRRRLAADRALALWTKGCLFLLAGMVALLSRLLLPEWVAVLLGNPLVLCGMLYFNQAVYVFVGKGPVPKWVTGMVVAAVLATPVLLAWPISTRSMVFSVVLMLMAGAPAVHVFRHAWHAESTMRAVGLTMLMLSLAHAARAVQAGLVPDQYLNFFQSSMGQGIVVLLAFLALLGSGVGFVMASLERTAKSMEFLASHDALTGCLNRRSFDPLCEHEVARSRRSGEPLALLVLDLDHFKQVNDLHGHRCGDLVLQGFAQRVQSRLRSGDVFARLGGEEFAVLLPHTDLAGALGVANYLCSAVASNPVPLPDDQLLALTVSVGLAMLTPHGGQAAPLAQRQRATTAAHISPELLYMRADQALYQAKRQGRNQVVVWQAEAVSARGAAVSA